MPNSRLTHRIVLETLRSNYPEEMEITYTNGLVCMGERKWRIPALSSFRTAEQCAKFIVENAYLIELGRTRSEMVVHKDKLEEIDAKNNTFWKRFKRFLGRI